MASNLEDTLGCVVGLVVVVGGAWWLYDHYEIKERNVRPAPILTAAPTSPTSLRPIGLVETGTLKDGTVWRLDADSVTGPSEARLAWVREDHSKTPKVKARETTSLYSINCKTTGYRTLKVIQYNKEGVAEASWGQEMFGKDPDYAPPSTYIGRVITEVCKPYFDPREETAPAIRPTAPQK